jgi:hypothetical protein
MARTAQDIEEALGITLPDGYKGALANEADPIHQKITLLGPEGNDVTNILAVNSMARAQPWKEWPPHLVAFATTGCDDYFAFDTRASPYRVYYVDPIDTVPQSIRSCEDQGFVFDSFDEWYRHELSS